MIACENSGHSIPDDFPAFFQNAGYMGLYGGLDVDDIHTKKDKLMLDE